MLPDDTRSKIENITAGIIIEGESDNCTSIQQSLMRQLSNKYNG